MVKLADTLDSGSSDFTVMEVQVLFRAKKSQLYAGLFFVHTKEGLETLPRRAGARSKWQGGGPEAKSSFGHRKTQL